VPNRRKSKANHLEIGFGSAGVNVTSITRRVEIGILTNGIWSVIDIFQTVISSSHSFAAQIATMNVVSSPNLPPCRLPTPPVQIKSTKVLLPKVLPNNELELERQKTRKLQEQMQVMQRRLEEQERIIEQMEFVLSGVTFHWIDVDHRDVECKETMEEETKDDFDYVCHDTNVQQLKTNEFLSQSTTIHLKTTEPEDMECPLAMFEPIPKHQLDFPKEEEPATVYIIDETEEEKLLTCQGPVDPVAKQSDSLAREKKKKKKKRGPFARLFRKPRKSLRKLRRRLTHQRERVAI